MAEFEIRLVGHSGRVQAVYMVAFDTLQEAVKAADTLVRTNPDIAGAQVQSAAPLDSPTLH